VLNTEGTADWSSWIVIMWFIVFNCGTNIWRKLYPAKLI
jgi:hypothetical protein